MSLGKSVQDSTFLGLFPNHGSAPLGLPLVAVKMTSALPAQLNSFRSWMTCRCTNLVMRLTSTFVKTYDSQVQQCRRIRWTALALECNGHVEEDILSRKLQ